MAHRTVSPTNLSIGRASAQGYSAQDRLTLAGKQADIRARRSSALGHEEKKVAKKTQCGSGSRSSWRGARRGSRIGGMSGLSASTKVDAERSRRGSENLCQAPARHKAKPPLDRGARAQQATAPSQSRWRMRFTPQRETVAQRRKPGHPKEKETERQGNAPVTLVQSTKHMAVKTRQMRSSPTPCNEEGRRIFEGRRSKKNRKTTEEVCKETRLQLAAPQPQLPARPKRGRAYPSRATSAAPRTQGERTRAQSTSADGRRTNAPPGVSYTSMQAQTPPNPLLERGCTEVQKDHTHSQYAGRLLNADARARTKQRESGR
ncbi:hypothetical protein DFH06DRAFT_1118016 [Mycena polygramma]|nr:hypothetical protein DFH06DRAFT_1118016 [Mycena polygramma]